MISDEERTENRLKLIEDENVKAMARKIFREKGYDAMKTFTYAFIYGTPLKFGDKYK